MINNFAFLDFEASSLSQESYPISCGVYFRGETYYWIIKPEHDWSDWNAESQQIHGLTRQFLLEHGVASTQAYNDLNTLLSEVDTIYSDNPPWELMWLKRLGNCRFHIKHVNELIHPLGRVLFAQTCDKIFKREGLIPHRADHDAKVIALSVVELINIK